MKILFTFCLIFFTFFLSAQEVKFSFEKQQILLGEQIQMKIEALVAPGQSTNLFTIDTMPHFEVIDKGKADTSMVSGRMKIVQIFAITSWDSGRWEAPALIIDGKTTQYIPIDVVYTSPWNPQQPYHDIKGIVPVKDPGKSTWWWYVIGAAVLVALFLLFFPEGKKNKTASLIDANAYKKAMQQLSHLESSGIASTNVKQYYTELIAIFRMYLRGAKGIESLSKTTDDLSIQLQNQKIPQQEYNTLVQTLRLSDLVKFAQYKPDEKISKESISIIKDSITGIDKGNVV